MTSPLSQKDHTGLSALKVDDAALLQDHVRELYFQQILPALQQVLEEHGRSDSGSFNTMTINLEKLAQATSEEQLKELIRLELFPEQAKDNDHEAQVHPDTNQTRALQGLAVFLQQGLIPEYFRPAKGFNFSRLLEGYYHQNPTATLDFLCKSLKDQTARQRFINQFTLREALNWILKLTDKLQLSGYTLLEEWIRLLQQGIFSSSITRQLLELLLNHAVTIAPHGSAISILAHQLLMLRRNEAKKAILLASHLIKLNPDVDIQHRTLLISSANPKVPVPVELLPLNQEDTPASKVVKDNTSIPVANAGLVLLYDFIKPYILSVIGVNEKMLQELENRVRAAQLLHFLCTGQSGTPEHQLVFNKVLCDVPLYHPIPARLIITAKVRRETTELLKTVITHWSILKCSSITHLRDHYLMRNGLLERSENGWIIKMEQQPDKLLTEQLLPAVHQFETPFDKQLIQFSW